MTEVFLALLQMGLMAAGVAVISLPLRWLFRRLRLPAVACLFLWGVVLFRMVFPVGLLTSSFSLMGWLAPAVEERVDALAQGERREPTTAPAPNPPAETAPPEQSAAPGFSIPEAAPSPEVQAVPEPEGLPVLEILARVWLVGVAAAWGYTLFSWLRTRALLSTAVRRGSDQEGWWWESDRIPTAFVFGLLHPRVYVPAGLERENLRWVRLHEETHIRLWHHWTKPLYFLAVGLHWFNPLLWLAWALFCRDLELHCDEQVLSAADGERQAYSAALLALAAPRRGPLLPPGFGETGVKDRIKRALKWKRPARWLAVLVVIGGLLLAWVLAADPTFPNAGLNGQNPTLRIHLEEDGPGDTEGETVVDMAAPEDAFWPEELPETVRTAPTPSPWVDLYLDDGAFPNRWSLTEYLVEDGAAVNPREVELSPYGAENGFLLRVEPREDSPGTGMETRLYVLSCTWREGIRTHELEYAFQLTLPSVPPGPLTEPVVVAGNQRVELLAWGSSATAAMGEVLSVTLPDEVTAYTLEGGEEGYAARRTLSQGNGGGSFGVRIAYLDSGGLGTRSGQTQTYTLTCTWADGSQSDYVFTLYAYTPPPEWDGENLRIRFPGDTEWTNLDTLIPVPAQWAEQDLGGRNEAADLVGVLDGTGGMVDSLNGWFVFTIGQGAGNADTYVYRTHDGGRTWTETGTPDAPGTALWYPSCARFVSDEVGYIGFQLFEGAPVFRTIDGGENWEEMDLPLPEGTWVCTEVEDACRLRFTSPEGDTCTVYSYDGGRVWYAIRPIDDPETIPLEELPWPSREQSGYFQPNYSIWADGPVKMLGFSDDRTAAVFCFDEGMTGQSGLLLCVGGQLAYFPELTCQVNAYGSPANPVWGDFDGDGADELAVIPISGTGTGVFMQDLYVFEWDGQSVTLGGAIDAYEVRDMDLSLPANRRIRSQVRFWTEGDAIMAEIGVENSAAPHTTDYVGALTGPVTYDGRGLTLDTAALTYTEDASF